MNRKFLVLIVGPTAVGKTELCVKLAENLQTDIISCDSRQFYREMNIGTAKPSLLEMKDIKHHFINSHSIAEVYSAGDYERDAIQLLKVLFENQNLVIITGGSGLFVKAITDGLDDMPTPPESLRNELMQRLEKEGLPVLLAELKKLDPIYYAQIDQQNTQRVVRALEVCLLTGKPFSSFHQKSKIYRDFEIIKIALDRPRNELYDSINKRMDLMLEQGLVAEAESLLSFRNHPALQTLGYKEVFGYLDGNYDKEKMVELLKRNSRRYAKRQLTWFRNQDQFEWFHPKEEPKILQYIQTRITQIQL